MIEIYNNENKQIQCEVLFTFTENNKSFIVYKDKENDILASYYKLEGDKLTITPITNELDYDIVDKKLEEWGNQNV